LIEQVALLSFLAVAGLFSAIMLLLRASRLQRREALRVRLGRLAPAGELLREHPQEGDSSMAASLAAGGIEWTSGGFYLRLAVIVGLGTMLGLALQAPLLSVALSGIGAAALYGFVKHAREVRQSRCEAQMPRALEIMNMALRAGNPLPRALQLATEESSEPLRTELQRAVDEQSLGKPIADVMKGLGARLPGSPTANSFATAVLVLQETGGNLIAVLERIVDNAHARTRYQKRLVALTAEGRTSAKVLALLPVVFLLLSALTDPSYARFFIQESSGQTVAVICLLWWCTGVAVLRRMLNKAHKA
jgi:tight adherence protein B